MKIVLHSLTRIAGYPGFPQTETPLFAGCLPLHTPMLQGTKSRHTASSAASLEVPQKRKSLGPSTGSGKRLQNDTRKTHGKKPGSSPKIKVLILRLPSKLADAFCHKSAQCRVWEAVCSFGTRVRTKSIDINSILHRICVIP